MNKQTTYSIGNRLKGEYKTVEKALIGAGFSKQEAEKLTRVYDLETKQLYLETCHGWFMVQGSNGKYINFEGVRIKSTDLKAVEFFCQTMNEVFEMSGNPNRVQILAFIPKSSIQ